MKLQTQTTISSMNNNDFHILELSAYQTPEIIEDSRKDYVAFGDDNLFYKELIDNYLNSPTSSSIINGVVNQIYGKGFSALDSARKPDEFAKFKALFKPKDLKRVCLDLKLLGEASFQVTYSKKQVASVTHFNRETLRAEKCDDQGKINAYYYHPKWENYKPSDELTRIPVFGSGAPNEIYIIRRHIPGMHYYSIPDYCASLNYARLESQISTYLMNEVSNSFSGTKLVSFTNGIPTQEKQMQIKREIQNKLTGSNGEKVIVSFSDSAENKTTIEDISVSDAADVYSYISEECSRKLLLGHRITSPLLIGIRDTGNSLGNNSEEIQNAHNLFENVVIKPFQNDIVDAIHDILAVNNIALNIYVQTLTPIEFTESSIVSEEQREEETGIKEEEETITVEETPSEKIIEESPEEKEDDLEDKQASYNGAQIASAIAILQNVKEGILTEDQAIVFLVQMLQFDIEVAKSMFKGEGSEQLLSSLKEKLSNTKTFVVTEKPNLSVEHEKVVIRNLKKYGEDISDEWELIEEMEVTNSKEEQMLSQINLFADTADADKNSKEDKGLYKLRYVYAGNPDPQRKFCQTMMKRNKGTKYGLLYRFEDIKKLSDLDPNPGLAKGGKNGPSSGHYDIFKFLGGNNCRHFWKRMIFFRKRENGKFLPKSKTDDLENDKRVANVPGLKRKGVEGKTPAERGIGNKKSNK